VQVTHRSQERRRGHRHARMQMLGLAQQLAAFRALPRRLNKRSSREIVLQASVSCRRCAVLAVQ